MMTYAFVTSHVAYWAKYFCASCVAKSWIIEIQTFCDVKCSDRLALFIC